MTLSNAARLIGFVALLAVVGCSKSSDKSGPGDAPAKVAVKGTASDAKLTPSYFPTTNPPQPGPEDAVWGPKYRKYIMRSYNYKGSLAKNPQPDLTMRESTHSGKWVMPSKSELSHYGQNISVWVNDESGKTKSAIDNSRRVYRITDVGIEVGDSVGAGLAQDSWFYYWTPVAKWQGEWSENIQKGKLDRRVASFVESKGSNNGKSFVVVRIVRDNVDDRPGVYLSSLRRLWLMDGIGIVREEMYGSGTESPQLWRPAKQLIYEEWVGDVAPLAYLPRDAK